jgi:hypothetical protein
MIISYLSDVEGRELPNSLTLIDHMGGFTQDLQNGVLEYLNGLDRNFLVSYHQVLTSDVTSNVPLLDFRFSSKLQDKLNLNHFHGYTVHPDINFKNFLCSFNGTTHVSRQLLTSMLRRFGLFNTLYSSKNFAYGEDQVNGQLSNLDLSQDQQTLYSKFLTTDDKFLNEVYSFGHDSYNHSRNIYNLESKLVESFVHIVSETKATSYYPFITEKFLYSIVTRGLFLTYGQPKWHKHVEQYYGFKKYDKIFDYRFDNLQNPVERLVELITMVSKFSMLSASEWHDLYLLEVDTIEYNYDHYFSKSYLEQLKKYEN